MATDVAGRFLCYGPCLGLAMTRMRTRYPITAIGLCNALGGDTEAVLRALADGRTGLVPVAEPPGPRWCGRVEHLPALPPDLERYDTRQARLTWATWVQIAEAVERARTRWSAERIAIVIGTSTGGIAATEAAYAEFTRTGEWDRRFKLEHQHEIAATLAVLREASGARGPTYAVSTACSSSAKALAAGKRLLELDVVDAVLTGGIDTLCGLTEYGFAGLGIISDRPAQPLSVHRAGINLGEGGALLLLERHGDSQVDLVAVGESNDAYHMSSPHPHGLGARLAMERALASAGISRERVAYVNVHATGTEQGDRAEARAIAAVLGSEAKVVATKAYMGHLLGAAGATEAAFAALSIVHGWVPESLGATPVDPACALEVVTRRTAFESDYVLSNSLAFGGSNASVLLGAREP